jgi:hypothetical protein
LLLPTALPDLAINWTTALGIRAHHHKARQAVGGVDFNFNDGGFEADHGAGEDFGKHGAKCI